MNDEGGDVDAVCRVVKLVAAGVDLHQARRGDLVEQEAVGVDQKLVLMSGDTQRNMIVDQIIHAELRHHAVAGGELDPRIPFGRIDPARCGRDRLGLGVHCSCSRVTVYWNDFMLSSSMASSSVRLRRMNSGAVTISGRRGRGRSTTCSSFTEPGRAVMTSTRSPRKIASSTSWVMKRIVRRYFCQTSSSQRCIIARVSASSAPNGSSSSIRSRSNRKLRIRATRWRMPPDN